MLSFPVFDIEVMPEGDAKTNSWMRVDGTGFISLRSNWFKRNRKKKKKKKTVVTGLLRVKN
jgi:hypothetical protein